MQGGAMLPVSSSAAAAVAALNSLPPLSTLPQVPDNIGQLIAGVSPTLGALAASMPLPMMAAPPAPLPLAAPALLPMAGPAPGRPPLHPGAVSGAPGSLERQQSLPKGRPTATALRRMDCIKAIRKELLALEADIPWNAVDIRWRKIRGPWSLKLRTADTVQIIAVAMRDLYDSLNADKGAGLFAAGGPWERTVLDLTGAAGQHTSAHLHLQQVWDEMRNALQLWLNERQLPGSFAHLDRTSYESAVRAYHSLHDAAAQGSEFLDQVPLDMVLSNPRELAALQQIIGREAAHTQAQLQALAKGLPPPPGGDGGDGVLASLSLDQLRKIRTRAGGDSDVDTDLDVGSEATDMDDSD